MAGCCRLYRCHLADHNQLEYTGIHPTHPKPLAMRRLFSIDILRATAILLMIQVHFVGNLSPREPSSQGLYDLSTILGAFAAPIFTFLVGLSLWLWLNKQKSVGAEDSALRRFIIKRGILIFLFGLIFAVIIWTPAEIFNWDILALIGISTMIVYALRRVPAKYLIALSVLILLIAPPLRELTDYGSHWIYDEYAYDFTLSEVLLGVTLQGYFPLLPWLVFPIIGFCLGRDILQREQTNPKAARNIPTLGLILIVIAAVSALISQYFPIGSSWYLSPYSFYPASTTFVISKIGFILLAFWFLRWRFDLRESSKPAGGEFIRLYSKFSLTTYAVHHAVHVWPIYLLAALNHPDDIWYYYQDAVSTPVALGLSFVFSVVFYFFLRFLDSRKQLSLEGMLRRLSES